MTSQDLTLRTPATGAATPGFPALSLDALLKRSHAWESEPVEVGARLGASFLISMAVVAVAAVVSAMQIQEQNKPYVRPDGGVGFLLVGGDQMNATLSWGGHPAVVLAILVATLVVGVGLMIVTHFRSRDLLAPPAGMAEKGRLRAREPLQ